MGEISQELWLEVEKMFIEALSHAPERRRAFLVQACGQNQQLFEVVDSLVAVSSEAENFIEAPAISLIDIAPPVNEPLQAHNPLAALPGVERFERTLCLGAGGVGRVYKALDKQRNRFVALKQFSTTKDRRVRRFIAEFKELRELTHPHLMPLYEIYEHEENCYFTMDFVQGWNIKDYVKLRGLDKITILVKQLADALQTLHDSGKLHLNIKPANILVDHSGNALLTDAGLGIEPIVRGTMPATQDSKSIAYLSPEQCTGQRTSPASDWYSLGAVLYEAITGTLPFAGTVPEIVLAKRRFMPLPAKALKPEIAEELSDMCEQLLKTNPAARISGKELFTTETQRF